MNLWIYMFIGLLLSAGVHPEKSRGFWRDVGSLCALAVLWPFVIGNHIRRMREAHTPTLDPGSVANLAAELVKLAPYLKDNADPEKTVKDLINAHLNET